MDILQTYLMSQNDYLKAEAQLLNGDASSSANTINNSPGRISSGLPVTALSVQNDLLYEYSIELHLNGTIGTNYFYEKT